jgi:mannose-1-phosphate guanylyltransferase
MERRHSRESGNPESAGPRVKPGVTGHSSIYALILAGGEGTRFAPLSTPDRPKQFLSLVGERSLIAQTAERIRPLIPTSQWWTATNAKYVPLIREHLPELPIAHIIGETHKKNTAPAIALAAACLNRRDPKAVMVVLPSDHVIINEIEFRRVLQKAIQFSETHDDLVTLGITPAWASPSYGYIEEGVMVEDGIYRVKRFVEKPDVPTAEKYLKVGTYAWNSGMFVWRTSVILKEIEHHLPRVHQLLSQLSWSGDVPSQGQIQCYFEAVDSVSIDYGIMEKSQHVVMIPADMGWNDVGTWDSLKALVKSGVVQVQDEVQQYITQYANS